MEARREATRAEEWPDIDDHLVRFDARAEIVRGRLIMTPPADHPHGPLHLLVGVVVHAHLARGYEAAIDLLTRTSLTSDFAPDVSIYRRDAVSGKRQFPVVAFEIVSRQRLTVAMNKARELYARGTRRIFCLAVRKMQILEWSPKRDTFVELPADAAIRDPCFVRGFPVKALLDRATADRAVLSALRAKRVR